MRRRDLTIGLLLAAAVRLGRAQEGAKQDRIAIIIPAGPIAIISDTGSDMLSRRLYGAFFEELSRLGHVEQQNLTVERYSGEGHPEHYVDLAGEVAGHNPDLIIAITNPLALAVRAASGAIPILWTGAHGTAVALAPTFSHPT